jgi:hypothetical protein
VLLEHGYEVVLIDNLRNSFMRAYDHMQRLAGSKADKMKFVKVRARLGVCVGGGGVCVGGGGGGAGGGGRGLHQTRLVYNRGMYVCGC